VIGNDGELGEKRWKSAFHAVFQWGEPALECGLMWERADE